MLMAGTLYSRIITTIAAIFPNVLTPILMSSTSLLYGSTVVAKNSLMQAELKQEQRATMGSLDSFVGSLFFGLVAFCLGLLADRLSPIMAILILQVFQLSMIVVYAKLFKYPRLSPQPKGE